MALTVAAVKYAHHSSSVCSRARLAASIGNNRNRSSRIRSSGSTKSRLRKSHNRKITISSPTTSIGKRSNSKFDGRSSNSSGSVKSRLNKSRNPKVITSSRNPSTAALALHLTVCGAALSASVLKLEAGTLMALTVAAVKYAHHSSSVCSQGFNQEVLVVNLVGALEDHHLINANNTKLNLLHLLGNLARVDRNPLREEEVGTTAHTQQMRCISKMANHALSGLIPLLLA